MTESKRAFYFKEAANSLVLHWELQRCGAISYKKAMLWASRCYSRTLGPRCNCDGPQAVCKAHRGPIDGFEVWDGARLVIKHSGQSAPSIA